MTYTRTEEQILEHHPFIARLEGDHRASMIAAVHTEDSAYESYPVPVPCPEWCRHAASHRYEEYDDDLVWSRTHTLLDSSHDVDVIQEERNKGGSAVRGPVVIRVYHEEKPGNDEIDGAELRLRAQEMLRIADRYDEIMASS
jgi:hypothetical protein